MRYPFYRFASLLMSALLLVLSCEKEDNGEEEKPGGDDSTTVIDPSAFTQSSPWTIIGTLGGSSWDKDFEMLSSGNWHAAFSVSVTATDQFKFRKNRSWDTNFGASIVKVGEKIALVPGGDNIKIPAGTYDFYITESNQIGYILPAAIRPSTLTANYIRYLKESVR